MKLVRDRGVFIPKEYITTNVFRAQVRKAGDEWKPTTLSEDGKTQFGFLPTLPTGIAIDRVGASVYITSAYDERGIAKCRVPQDWAEL